MNEVTTPSVPAISEQWISSRREHLLTALPQQQRRAGLKTVTIGATCVGVCATATTLGLLLGGTTPAFAGWSSSPTTPGPGQSAAAIAACQTRITTAAALNAPAEEGGKSGGPSQSAPHPPAILDTRGPFSEMIFASPGADGGMLCIAGPNLTAIAGASAPNSAGAGSAALGRVSYDGGHFGQPYTLAEGIVGTGTTAVDLTLDDGSLVQTTVANGWFLAWWPGTQGIASLQAESEGGTQSESVNVPGPSLPPGGGKP